MAWPSQGAASGRVHRSLGGLALHWWQNSLACSSHRWCLPPLLCPCVRRRWQLGGQPSLDWPTFLAKKNAELERLNGIYMNLLKNSGVEVGSFCVHVLACWCLCEFSACPTAPELAKRSCGLGS